MQDKQHPSTDFVHSVLPWIVALGAFLVYAVTLNHWVTLDSLPFVAKVTGWDWVIPLQAPLFFFVTYPIRWLPAEWQPMALNLFAAACSAASLGLLARCVSLLPHDRTHAQRQRERTEFSLLSTPSAWVPPVFAALICGLQLTFWEHSIAATNESLSLLVFAYAIRCLLEYRLDGRETWMSRLALVYGLGVANNWAMIGFFPCFLVALIWIKGTSFFRLNFFGRMMGIGAIGLLLYLLLPLAWSMTDSSVIDFGQALRAQLKSQKAFLMQPDLRSRVLVLSLTSVLPVLIMGIRWPSSFGDTSAAGAVVSNVMFRAVHVVFLGACLYMVFDQKFSPRALITSRYPIVPLLTLYYLTALSVGYFSGYVLLVFGEGKDKSWKHRGASELLLNRAFTAALWLALVGVPAGLIYKNFRILWENSGPLLKQFAELCAAPLSAKKAIVLSDDLPSLLLLQAHLSHAGDRDKHVLVHSRSLVIPEYHHQLVKRYPGRWPNILEGEAQGELLDDMTLLKAMTELSQTNDIYYLHPSFGFYFESFQTRPEGLVTHLRLYDTNTIAPPPISSSEFETNQLFWSKLEPSLRSLHVLTQRDSRDAQYLGMFYSRALNDWGVAVQKAQRFEEASRHFELASQINTNNKPARVNFAYNRRLRSSGPRSSDASESAEDRMGGYRDWESLLAFNGPFDEPGYCIDVGRIFLDQNLYRQAAIQFRRVQTLEPTNILARLALANVYLEGHWPDQALQQAEEIRSSKDLLRLSPDDELAAARIEASAFFSKTNHEAAERILLKAQEKYPDRVSPLEALARFYAHAGKTTNALSTIEKLLKLDSGNVPALIDQSTIYFNQRAYEQALRSLDRVLQNDRKNLQALLYKVLLYIETKDYKNALAQAERVLEINPDNYEALLHKGVILIETKAYDQAIEPLTHLLKLQPNDSNALRNRAIANLQRGKLDEAKRDYERLQRQMPRYHVAYYGLGEIAYRRKETAAAIRSYEYYLKYAPEEKKGESSELSQEKKMVNERLKELKAPGH